MNNRDLRQALLTYGDKHTIRQGIEQRLSAPRQKRKKWVWTVLATLLVIGISAGCAAEAKQYRQAVAFFEENSLSTEGLTRKQIKAVYKDITLKTYSYETTAEVLNRLSVELFHAPLPQEDPAELALFWQNYLAGETSYPDGLHYRVDYEGDIPLVSRFNGEKKLWTYTFSFETYVFAEENLIETENGVLIYGQDREHLHGMAILLDLNGNVLWQHFSTEAYSTYEAAIIDSGETVLFGKKHEKRPDENGRISGNTYSFLFVRLDSTGQLSASASTEIGPYLTVHDAVKVGERYLLKQGVQREEGFLTQLVFVSPNGTPETRLEYTDGKQSYRICDLLVQNGQVYLSAELLTCSEARFEGLFVEALSNRADKKLTKKLTDLFTSQYTATLLICDENGVAHKAYSTQKARAGTLKGREDDLFSWQIFRIDSISPAPAYLSSRRVDILATEFEMIFGSQGELICRNELGPRSLFY